MASMPRHRRKRKIRRNGRHTSPSQVEKVAQQAGKAAPAVAVVGALAAAPQLHDVTAPEPAAVAGPVAGGDRGAAVAGAHPDAAVANARLDAVVFTAHPARFYTVRPGDTLAGIAWRFYGRANDWPVIYRANRSKISNPSLIYPGQVFRVPLDPPHQGRHHRTDGDRDGDDGPRGRHHRGHGRHYRGVPHGNLGCGGLEQLWLDAGGRYAAQVTAASIAMAESSGRQYATGPYGERGYWQINPVNGSLSTYDAYGNARAAIILSSNGRDWTPWTTYDTGVYQGRC